MTTSECMAVHSVKGQVYGILIPALSAKRPVDTCSFLKAGTISELMLARCWLQASLLEI